MQYRFTRNRATKDIDLLIQPNLENGHKVYAALAEFGAPLTGLTAEAFVERKKFFRMGQAPLTVDILPEIDGIDFDEAWQRRIDVVIEPLTGLTAHFISREDLIKAKLAAGRPQDVADVAALRKAKESRPTEIESKKESPEPPKTGPTQ